MTFVPQAWTDAMGHLRAAQVERDIMRDPHINRQGQDLATVRYTRSVDALVDALSRLSEDQTLGRITLFLDRKERG